MPTDWLLWQLTDSAFPTGGFAHSGGLEAAVQIGFVSDAQTLERFIQAMLSQLGRGVAQFALAAWDRPDEFVRIDRECDLFLNNHVSNRASRMQGQALLSSASKIFLEAHRAELISRWAIAARRDRLASHLAPVFGLVANGLGICSEQAMMLFLFTHLRGATSAAVRLGIVGPMQGQQIQSRFAAESNWFNGDREAVQINPMVDLLQMNQDRFYSRLFQS
jgi:urease accessory protein